MLIYLLLCPINNIPKYIGKTKFTIPERIKSHIKESKNTKKNTKKISWIRSLLKNDLVPIYEILEICNENDVNFWEQHYISLYKSWGFELKNQTIGGDGQTNMSLENRKKLSEACKKMVGEKNPFYGKKHSEETLKKLRNKKISKETLNKMSLATKSAHKDGRLNTKGSKHPMCKKIIQYDLEMNEIKIWDYITEIEQYGFTRRNALRCLKGETKIYKGFIWKYYLDVYP